MEEFANHSEVASPESTGTPIETSSAPEVSSSPDTTQEPPKGLTVKYNKEDRFVPDDELPTYVQKGLNYDKVAEQAKQAQSYQQSLERIAKFYGYNSHDEYMQALDAHEQQLRIQQEADKLGVDESVIREHLQPMKDKLAEYEKEKAALQQERLLVQIEKDVTDLKGKYSDFEKYQDQVFDMAIKHGYRLEDAYRLATYDDKLSSIAKQTEAETIKKIQQNGATSTGSLGAEGAEHKTGFTALSKEAQRRMIEEVKQGKRTTFD